MKEKHNFARNKKDIDIKNGNSTVNYSNSNRVSFTF